LAVLPRCFPDASQMLLFPDAPLCGVHPLIRVRLCRRAVAARLAVLQLRCDGLQVSCGGRVDNRPGMDRRFPAHRRLVRGQENTGA
jgi:hypothetical protein